MDLQRCRKTNWTSQYLGSHYPTSTKWMTQEFYDAYINFCNIQGSEEKRLSLFLNKRIRKSEEHVLHDSTNTVDTLRSKLPLHSLVPLCWENSWHQLQLKQWFQFIFFVTYIGWADFFTMILGESIKGESRIQISGQKLSRGLFTALVAENNHTVQYLLTTVLRFPHNILWHIWNQFLFNPSMPKPTINVIVHNYVLYK